MIQTIIKRHRNALWLMVCILCACLSLNAQGTDVLVRTDDEGVWRSEERRQALTSLIEAGRQSEMVGEPLKAAGFLNRAGRLQLALSLPDDALTTYQTALKLTTPATESTVRIDSTNGVAAAYTHLSQCDLARPFVRDAIVSSERVAYVAGKAEALLTQAACQNYKDHAAALQTAREALALWQSVNRTWWIAKSHAAIGHYQLAQNDLIEATESYGAALALWRELNVVPEEAEALISLGFIEQRKGAWTVSLSFLTQAQGLLDEKAEPFKMGQIAGGIGEAFLESGLPETGLTKLQQSLEYYRLAKSPRAVLVLNWDIGRAYYFLGDYPRAMATLQAALDDAESIQVTVVAALCHDFLGRTLVAMDERAKALEHFQTAFELYTKVGNRMEAARTRALLGRVYEEEGKTKAARNNYRTALRTFRELSDHVNESATLFALGKLELKQNNLDEADQYLRQSIDVTENMRRVSGSSDLATAFSATVYERYQSYVECLMRKHQLYPDRGFAALAFETSELGRARSLGEMLRSTATSFAPGVDPQLVTQEKSLRQSLRVKEDHKVRLLSGAYKREELALLEADLARLEEEYKKVTAIIQTRYPAFGELTRPGAWDLKQIQTQVIADDQTVLLEYSLGTDKSYVWAATRQGLKSYELPPQKVITDAARKVYELLSTAPNAETENQLNLAARELSEMVLAPVGAQLNKARIIVVADGALNYIPFQFLPAPSAAGEQMVAGYEVINAPSASILGQLRLETARRPPAANILAAFGDPVFRSNFAQQADKETLQQLPADQAETARWQHASRDIQPTGDAFDPAAIEQLFFSKLELSNLQAVAGDKTLLATRFDATTDKLKNTDLTKYAILHLATHGILDPKRPEKSGLILSTVNSKGQSQNGFVGLEDIYSLHAPVDLVVLSACRTGLGKDVQGEGLIGLTRGFLYAGASSVVASLWKVDDEATAELMKRFYINMLKRGMRPPEALRAAQNSIRLEPQWRAPYYWAAFTLQGDYLQPVRSSATSGGFHQKTIAAMAGVVCLALLAVGAWWYFRRGRDRHSIAN